MRTTTIDERIGATASRQYMAFSRQQAFEAGASMRFIERRVAAFPVPEGRFDQIAGVAGDKVVWSLMPVAGAHGRCRWRR